MRFRDALLDAWALLMPVECAGCEKPDRSLCGSCAGSLVPLPTARATPGGLRVVTALRYETVVLATISPLASGVPYSSVPEVVHLGVFWTLRKSATSTGCARDPGVGLPLAS